MEEDERENGRERNNENTSTKRKEKAAGKTGGLDDEERHDRKGKSG